MLEQTITHYAPWDASDETDDRAYCGHRMGAHDRHSLLPTCPGCVARLDAEADAIEDTALPLDADEARTELDPVLNAGVPAQAPLSPLAAEVFALGVSLNRILYANHFPPEARLFAGRRRR